MPGTLQAASPVTEVLTTVRDTKKVKRYLEDAEKVFSLDVLTAEDDAALKKAVAKANEMLATTVIDTEYDAEVTEELRVLMAELVAKYDLATDEVKEQLDDYSGLQRGDYKPASEPDKTTEILTAAVGATAKLMTIIFGKKGFADFWSFLY